MKDSTPACRQTSWRSRAAIKNGKRHVSNILVVRGTLSRGRFDLATHHQNVMVGRTHVAIILSPFIHNELTWPQEKMPTPSKIAELRLWVLVEYRCDCSFSFWTWPLEIMHCGQSPRIQLGDNISFSGRCWHSEKLGWPWIAKIDRKNASKIAAIAKSSYQGCICPMYSISLRYLVFQKVETGAPVIEWLDLG